MRQKSDIKIDRFGMSREQLAMNVHYLPGDKDFDLIDEVIRVDHAGESGAVVIYQGQQAADTLLRRLFSNLRNDKLKQRRDEQKNIASVYLQYRKTQPQQVRGQGDMRAAESAVKIDDVSGYIEEQELFKPTYSINGVAHHDTSATYAKSMSMSDTSANENENKALQPFYHDLDDSHEYDASAESAVRDDYSVIERGTAEYADGKGVTAGEDFSVLVQHMLEQEIEHKQYFDRALNIYYARPSLLLPFWRAAGFSMGFITRIMGRDIAMCCTEAVEDVIEKHYAEQITVIEQLLTDDLRYHALLNSIKQFRAEELEHRDIAVNEKKSVGVVGAVYRAAYFTISVMTKIAIAIAKRL